MGKCAWKQTVQTKAWEKLVRLEYSEEKKDSSGMQPQGMPSVRISTVTYTSSHFC